MSIDPRPDYDYKITAEKLVGAESVVACGTISSRLRPSWRAIAIECVDRHPELHYANLTVILDTRKAWSIRDEDIDSVRVIRLTGKEQSRYVYE